MKIYIWYRGCNVHICKILHVIFGAFLRNRWISNVFYKYHIETIYRSVFSGAFERNLHTLSISYKCHIEAVGCCVVCDVFLRNVCFLNIDYKHHIGVVHVLFACDSLTNVRYWISYHILHKEFLPFHSRLHDFLDHFCSQYRIYDIYHRPTWFECPQLLLHLNQRNIFILYIYFKWINIMNIIIAFRASLYAIKRFSSKQFWFKCVLYSFVYKN